MKPGKLMVVLPVCLGLFLLFSSVFGENINKLKLTQETDLEITSRKFLFKDTVFFRSNIIYSENFNSGSDLTLLGFNGKVPTHWTLDTICKNMASTCSPGGASSIYTPKFKASRLTKNITISWTVLPAGKFSRPIKTLPVRILPVKTLPVKPVRSLLPLNTPEPIFPDWFRTATAGAVTLVDINNAPVYRLVYGPNPKGILGKEGIKVSLFKTGQKPPLGSAIIPVDKLNIYQLNFMIKLNCHADGGEIIVYYNKAGIFRRYIQCIKVQDETYQNFSKLLFGYQRGKAGQIAVDNIWVIGSAPAGPTATVASTATPNPTPTPVVDLNPPVTQIVLAPAPNGSGWVNSSVQIDFTSADDVSGVKETQYKIDGGTDTIIYDPLNPSVITTNGMHTVVYRSVDKVLHEETWHTESFTIDQTSPNTKAGPDPGANWYNSAYTITFIANDNADGSGVEETRYMYKVDTGSFGPEQTGNTVSFDTTGVYTVEYWSIDNLGNVELPHKTVILKMDKTGPDTTVSPDPGTDWHNGVLTLNFTADDHGRSGVGQIKYKYKVNGGAYGSEQAGNTVSFNTTGNYTVEYWALDNLNNEGAHQTITVNMDTDAPVTVPNLAPPSNTAGWNNSNFYVSLLATDTGGSGIKETRYKIDADPAEHIYDSASPKLIDTDGIHQLKYWSIDGVANVETEKSVELKLDKTTPVMTNVKPSNNFHYVGVLRPAFEANFSDVYSGIDTNNITVYLKVGAVVGTDFGPQLTGSKVITNPSPPVTRMVFTPDYDLTVNVNYTVTIKVSDLAGNENYTSRTFIIDPNPD